MFYNFAKLGLVKQKQHIFEKPISHYFKDFVCILRVCWERNFKIENILTKFEQNWFQQG